MLKDSLGFYEKLIILFIVLLLGIANNSLKNTSNSNRIERVSERVEKNNQSFPQKTINQKVNLK